ncbi:hypothetical protein [Pseudomonas sp.]|uniref:PA0061/PA0062 family lipoprotein n=1 Tax=Pseudomonas sp. TaxID=306 RepID=UPI0028A89663|nr:hypothetical protein [Pseudomonas sp.]
MRAALLSLSLLALHGCSLWLPRPDPNQAWVDLDASKDAPLLALEVDDKPLEDDRYFQVEPGSHALTVRYRFAVSAANTGHAEPLQRDCRLLLKYDDFDAGGRYRLVAGEWGFRPWVKLYDQQNQLLGRGQEQRCGGV